MPRSAKGASRKRKASGRGGAKRLDYKLFVLSSLVLVLFSLIVVLILTQKPPVSESVFAPSEEPWESEAPEASGAAPSPGESPEASPGPSLGPEESSVPPRKSPAPSPRRPTPGPLPSASPRRGGELVIVIDDVGHNSYQLEPFLALPFDITFAVLPGLPHTKECVKMLQAAGREYILHMPMEAIDGSDPGPLALTSGMSPKELHDALAAALERVPGARGMNNHMGSATTRDLAAMRHVLRFAKKRKLYFLDSRTIGETVARKAAHLEGYSVWERDVFLDNAQDKTSIRAMTEEGKKVASTSGRAVMIGHVWSAELAQTLMDLYPELVEEGYDLTTISKIMLDKDDEGPRD
jgi:polysaccharide deacetylase 2 family uncharacterized protein YibQ